MKLGFFVNPLAGFGIVTNSKGSDGLRMRSYEESKSVAKGLRFLEGIKGCNIEFTVPSGVMGSALLDRAGITGYRVIYDPAEITSASDTKKFVEALKETDIDALAFVGGDGTARDILASFSDSVPVIGIPAGMKMYSSVFSISVRSAIWLVKDLAESGIRETTRAEVVDIDEVKFRKGKLDISLFGEVEIPVTPLMVSQSKAEYAEVDVSGIAEYLREKMNEGSCYIIGPGSTCKSVMPPGTLKTNLLGFDIITKDSLLEEDADEGTIYRYASSRKACLIISPIGGQGFLLGRGNRQITPRIVEKVGWNNIWVLASQEKLSGIANLYVDIDNSQEVYVPAYIKVLYGYGRFRMIPVKR